MKRLVMALDADGVGVYRREAEMTLVVNGDTFRTVVERDKDSGAWTVNTQMMYDGDPGPFSGGAYDPENTLSTLLGQEIYAACNRDVLDHDLGSA